MTTTTAKEALGKALGRIASGIYVVTTGTGENKHGMLASFVMQASFEPPTVTVCVQHEREILEHLKTNRKFVINVLSDENSNLMGRFAKYKPEQFDDLDWYENACGIVLKETVAYLACELREIWTGGDHYVLLGEAVDGEILKPDLHPWTHLRKNGFSY